MIAITVYGTPAPQGSKRPLGLHGGKHIMVESSAKVKPWREAVKHAALEARNGAPPIDGPVFLDVTFTVRKPKSAPKRIRTFPSTKPDLSKLVRCVEDALTDAGIWGDDARVIECFSRKVYPNDHHFALDVPGVVIGVEAASRYRIAE